MRPFSSSNYCHKIEHDGKWWFIVLHGFGEIIYQNGARAEGKFRHDALHGLGEYTYADGAKYVGNMVNYDACGKGVVTFPDKSVLDGTFEKDCPIEGILELPDFSRFHVEYDGRTKITQVRATARARAPAHTPSSGQGGGSGG
jgi:hypothetical protein